MLFAALAILLVAAIFGAMLAVPHLRGGVARPAAGALHGVTGLAGFVVLLIALTGPPRGVAMGVGEFGRIGAVLLALTLLAGLGILVVRLRRRRVLALLIGIHATIAISGVVVLAAYALIGSLPMPK